MPSPRPRTALLATVALLAAPLIGLSAPAAGAASVHTAATPAYAAGDFCRITASSATVRAKPRKSAAALGTAYKNAKCTAHGWAGRGGTWVKVTMKRSGITGYVHSSLVAWGKEELSRTE